MNNLEIPLFLISALSALISALGVVIGTRLIRRVLLLAICMIALSVQYALLNAPFVAVIQVLIYAGAILVLFLLVVMLLGVEGSSDGKKKGQAPALRVLALFFALILAAIFIWITWHIRPAQPLVPFSGTVELISEALFTHHLLNFELVSVILLIGIFGVVRLSNSLRKK